jgi:hypothetical protein
VHQPKVNKTADNRIIITLESTIAVPARDKQTLSDNEMRLISSHASESESSKTVKVIIKEKL